MPGKHLQYWLVAQQGSWRWPWVQGQLERISPHGRAWHLLAASKAALAGTCGLAPCFCLLLLVWASGNSVAEGEASLSDHTIHMVRSGQATSTMHGW